MVIHAARCKRAARRGSLVTEMVVGMAFLLVAIMPLAYSFARERRCVHASYQRTVAMEVVDGEMEILAAGEWRAFQPGTQTYTPARSTPNLPEGEFSITINGKQLRLEWHAMEKDLAGKVIREVTLK